MLEKYFSAPKTLDRLRGGLSGPHIDGFADALKQHGYSSASAVRYLRIAAHLGRFVQRKGGSLADIDPSMLDAFRRHLPRCRCPLSNGGRTEYHTRFGAKRFHDYLVQRGICSRYPSPDADEAEPELVVSFRDWFRKHRGAAEPTLRQYCRGAAGLLGALGADPSLWSAQQVRKFVLDCARQCGASTTQKLITSLRAFLRYLSFRGQCPADLDQVVPAVAHWRLATLTLSAEILDSLKKDEKAGWEFLASKQSATMAEYADHMEFDKRKAQRHLSRFVKLGLLRRVGIGHATRYEVVRL